MKTEYRLAEELKAMMSEIPLDDISVSALAKKCNVNRQTFYYHFHDIYDLLTLVFLNEKIEKITKVTNPQELLVTIYNYYSKNSKFIDAALESAGRDLFEAFINNSCYTAFMKMVLDSDHLKVLTLNERKNISRFYAYAFSNVITFYLSNSKNKDLEGLIKCFSFLEGDFIKKFARKFKR